MTPPARIAAAIEILDQILDGQSAEQILTNWARRNRYAGSGDRRAIRDLVFDAIRRQRSYARLGHGLSGRGLMIGALRAAGTPSSDMFTGQGYAPSPLTEVEQAPPPPLSELDALDCPDWIAPHLRQDLGLDFAQTMALMRDRAPLFLRVNVRKGDLETARHSLAQDGIDSLPHTLSPTALQVTSGASKVQRSKAYLSGLVEIQDVASQAVCAEIPIPDGIRVLDLCAGGGGKSLALAARATARFYAHDIHLQRMADLPDRSARAAASITVLTSDDDLARHAPFDLVIVDAPCSGSGAWRRQAEAKWRLTPERLIELTDLQARLLDQAATLITDNGRIAYITCALLAVENADQVNGFLARHPGWRCDLGRQILPSDGGDGLFVALLSR
ncbi:RsmB/NOP family class I SAM-dependent RNA methyltransferase [Actibacterium sp. 188UL27-1]|uniref:RsmB/NOP family class I SAM-dependent RNA methyltransferase n=1 Tax=Actibacterium sp. 188UL27-1 TaxID=2786961 RepID=UPI001959B75B|nr:RsmB/NOP family class I SAM-dependent RNA methyltransferase [Actibacterium sp. 188UL27-1]MBM7067802.1 RsmB/NOP family class I SAM-dependent RNA methyltransferase [Actibacterium sp. 188UL27-1]